MSGADALGEPDRFCSGPFGRWHLEYVERADSTNALAGAEPTDRRVVVTDHQQAGRGRMGRIWETPAGEALTMSATIDPGLPDVDWPWVPLLAGLVVAEALDPYGLHASVKWPNDVLVDGLKVAGILVERVVSAQGQPLAVVGIGLNVHQQELPVPTATSLARCGVRATRVDLLRGVLSGLEQVVSALPADLGQLRSRFAGRCVTVGQVVDVHLPSGEVRRGRAREVDPRGCLVVDTEGAALVVSAGDVVHVRPA